MGTLFVVATPIGNMKDITLRALEVLRSVDIILAEDTRVAKKIVLHYNIPQKILWRADARIEHGIGERVLKELERGKNIAFVSDAGTPNISDPGAVLVGYIREKNQKIHIEPIPGASAITTLLSVVGVSSNAFSFFGYPPHKKGRNIFFKKIEQSEIPVIIYESPHRVEKTILALGTFLGERKFCIGRELTKIHEELFWGNAEEALKHFVGERRKGEFIFYIPPN